MCCDASLDITCRHVRGSGHGLFDEHALVKRIEKWKPSSGSDWLKVGLITESYRYTPTRVSSSRYVVQHREHRRTPSRHTAVVGRLRHHGDPVYDEFDRGTHPLPPGI